MTYILRCCIAGLLACFLAVSPIDAQESGPDYVAWNNFAIEVETILEVGQASDNRLEQLRADLYEWRNRFLDVQDDNKDRLKNLESQLAALGPAPEGEDEEAEEIRNRRAQLTEQLSELSAPVKQANEAYTHSDGIIHEIDSTLRNRQADALLELGPSPLNPAHWVPALDDLQKSLSRSMAELQQRWISDTLRARAREQLPLILFLVFAGGMLLWHGRKWVRKAEFQTQTLGKYHRAVWRFLVSLGQILVPLLGIFALVQAVLVSGLVGTRWTLFLEHLPIWAAVLLGVHWLADLAFHPDDDVVVLPLGLEDRAQARNFCDILSGLYVFREMISVLIRYDNYSQASLAVVEFPLLVLSGLYLFRLGRVRNDAPMAGTAEAQLTDVGLFRLRFIRVLGRGAMIVGVVGPVMAAIGYLKVGSAAVFPVIATLAVTGAVLVLQSFINDLYALVMGFGDDEDENQGLLPVLAGFVLTMIALPILALIWGVRVADLVEIWTQFQVGFEIGDARISPSDFLVVVVVFVIGYMLTRLFQGALRSSVLPRTKIDKGAQNALVSGLGYIGIFIAAVVAITLGGLDLSSLAIVAGALSVGIGFGLQNIVSNFVSGIILLIERPITEGDWIEVNGVHGTVRDISVRSTRIETFDRYDMIVPNSDIVSGTVSNYTRGNVIGRIIVPVGVAYGNDTRQVEKILLNIARAHEMVLMNPAPYVVFKGFGADSLDFEIRAILRDVNQSLGVRTEMNHQITEQFAQNGIEIPFAQRDIWIRNPEALPGATSASEPKAAPETAEQGADRPAGDAAAKLEASQKMGPDFGPEDT